MLSPISIWRLGPETMQSLAELPASRLATLQAPFSEEERRRAAAFFTEGDRRTYSAAHAALRAVLSRILDRPPSSIEITSEGGAKPALRYRTHPLPDLRFNLSHTRNAVLIATAFACEVGIDIESHRPLDDLEALAQTILSPAELVTWESLDTASRPAAFYRIWTRKEACLKAIGLGLFRDPRAITVPASPEPLVTPVPVPSLSEDSPTSPWQLSDVPVWPGFSAALCWQTASTPGEEPKTPPGIPQTSSFHIETHDLTLQEIAPDIPA
jgi:4'-phosphopantetheinyl transferase